MSKQIINKLDIATSFGRAAQTYDAAAHFQRWVGEHLLQKSCASDARVILDLGCGTGYFSDALRADFSNASYVGLDLSEQMLRYAAAKHKGDLWLAGDAESLPFVDASVDLIFSSLAIQWCANLQRLFEEVRRVLSPGGSFMFATLLDGSLSELKASWAKVDQIEEHVNEFALLSDYQEAISASNLCLHVLDQEQKVLNYQEVRELTRELKMLGAHNIREERPKHLTGKARIRAFIEAYEGFRTRDGMLPATYQVLFGVVKKSL